MTPLSLKAGIYDGMVVHHRYGPKVHRLRYYIFQILFDLDGLEALAHTQVLSHNRFNWLSFYDADHGPDVTKAAPNLKIRMTQWLRARGLSEDGDRLYLLAMPRLLGFVFNPISLFFVVGQDAVLRHIVYQVNNTFGERHFYALRVDPSTDDAIRQGCEKRLHVSPFMDTQGMVYDFTLTVPQERFSLGIRLRAKTTSNPILYAGFKARRHELNRRNLWAVFWKFPLMTLMAVAGIHWEALILWLKGMALKPNAHLTKQPDHQTY
jgi:hypothetical protein